MASTLSTDAPAPSTSVILDPLGRAPAPLAHDIAHPILVAIDGQPSSAAALHLAAALARREGELLEVLTIEETLPSAVRGFCLHAAALNGDVVRRSGVLGKVRDQLHDELGDSGWRLHVEFGRVPLAIARAAAELDARLIVAGIGQPSAAQRLFGSETAGRILRYAGVPVLAVHPHAAELPQRAAVALDFSAPSLRAARAVAALIEPPGVLHLIHVSSHGHDEFPEGQGWNAVYRAGVEATFARLEAELSRPGVSVKSCLLEGIVAEQLTGFARKEGIDVIAAGSHSHDIIDRLLLGSVPAQLLRAAECSVLVAPPA